VRIGQAGTERHVYADSGEEGGNGDGRERPEEEEGDRDERCPSGTAPAAAATIQAIRLPP